MADQDRRGDNQHEHAWAELTWRNLFKIGIKWFFAPGVLFGWASMAIGVWTNWYFQLAIVISKGFLEYWYLFLSFGLLASAFFYVNHRLAHRKKPKLVTPQ